MEYHLVKKEDVIQNVNLTLTLGIVKILHNACVDILKEEPNMIAYKAALEELQEVIAQQESKTIRGVITAPKSALEQAIEFATEWVEKNKV